MTGYSKQWWKKLTHRSASRTLLWEGVEEMIPSQFAPERMQQIMDEVTREHNRTNRWFETTRISVSLAQSQVEPLGTALGDKRERTPVSGCTSVIGISL